MKFQGEEPLAELHVSIPTDDAAFRQKYPFLKHTNKKHPHTWKDDGQTNKNKKYTTMKKAITTMMLTALFTTSATCVSAQSANTTGAATNYAATQWEHYAADNYAGGTGTAEDPYLISTPEQFMKLAVEIENLGMIDDNWDADYTKGKYFKQTADLVFNENIIGRVGFADGDASIVNNSSSLRTFNGIGYKAGDVDYQRFGGTYDGDGHAIIGLYHQNAKSSGAGVFNFADGATVKNLIVKDAYITANANVGLIIGSAENNTTVINCQSSGIIYCGGSYHAGIVGALSNSTVANCFSDAWVWAKNNAGGLVGTVRNSSKVSNCYFNGWIGGVYSNMGKFKYWGAVSPEIGNNETTTTVPDPNDDTKTITICENPSKAENCYWTDTCSVRHKDVLAEAYNDAANCKYGVVTNCKAFAFADAANAVETLNAEASNIEGACGWEVGTNGMPQLKFNSTTGISALYSGETTSIAKVYSLDGVLVKKVQNGISAVSGLKKGIYVINGKKYVVE